MITRAPILILILAALAGCSSGLVPVPKTGPHVGEDPVEVPDEPPPGKVEIIPDPPHKLKHPVWIDGAWVWRGHRWAWQNGKWEEMQAGMYYAPPKTVRRGDGVLVHFGGEWKPVAPPK
jgi:hypothetical protein